MLKKSLAIAIDGPAAAGKSTVAKIVAEKLSCIYIDTGAMYRALTLNAIENNTDINDEKSLLNLLLHTEIELLQSEQGQLVYLNGQDVTDAIRSQ
ncbi:cytidylate kinase, partial [Virgibacillus halodenitrificans]|nr:cytidylate kinase [Virgibacillus halodenitrificans]